MSILLDGHDLIVEVESVCDPLEAGDLLVLFLHHPTHLLHLSSEILPALSIWNLDGYTCDIPTHLRSVTAFSRLGPLARGVRGPGLDSTSLEQSSSSEQRLKRLMSPGLQYGCGDSSPAQLPGINHNLYNSPPPLPYLQTQS